MGNRLELADNAWQRVSNKYIVVDVIGVGIFGIVFTAGSTMPALIFGQQWLWAVPAVIGTILVVTLVLTPRRVRSIGYQLRKDDLLFRRGLMFQRFVSIPYGRMQIVDINRGPLARALGLSELKFVTAAASSGVLIPGIPEADAEALRDRLVELAETRRAGL